MKVNRKIYKELKAKEHLIQSYNTKQKETDISKMYTLITKNYASYLKLYININSKTDILSSYVKDISADVRVLKTKQIFLNQEYF